MVFIAAFYRLGVGKPWSIDPLIGPLKGHQNGCKWSKHEILCDNLRISSKGHVVLGK